MSILRVSFEVDSSMQIMAVAEMVSFGLVAKDIGPNPVNEKVRDMLLASGMAGFEYPMNGCLFGSHVNMFVECCAKIGFSESEALETYRDKTGETLTLHIEPEEVAEETSPVIKCGVNETGIKSLDALAKNPEVDRISGVAPILMLSTVSGEVIEGTSGAELKRKFAAFAKTA